MRISSRIGFRTRFAAPTWCFSAAQIYNVTTSMWMWPACNFVSRLLVNSFAHAPLSQTGTELRCVLRRVTRFRQLYALTRHANVHCFIDVCTSTCPTWTDRLQSSEFVRRLSSASLQVRVMVLTSSQTWTTPDCPYARTATFHQICRGVDMPVIF